MSWRSVHVIGVVMPQPIAFLLILFAIASPVQAQVYKCAESGTGKITFSDVPCHGKNSGHAIEVKPTNQFDGSGLRRQAERQRWEDRSRASPVRGGGIADPAAVDRASDRTQSAACAEARKPIPGARGETASQRSAIMAACHGVNVPPTQYAPSASPNRIPIPAPPIGPSVITNCDAGGCWDNVGGRYSKGAGNIYIPASGGGACQMIGGMMHCP